MDSRKARTFGSTEARKSSDPDGDTLRFSTLPSFRASDLDLCVRCAGCKAPCPTLDAFANEGMGARGRVALLRKFLTGEIGATDELAEKLETCLLCGACDSACPLGIPVTDLIYEGRRRLAESGTKRQLIRRGLQYAFMNPSRTFRILQILNKAARSSLSGLIQPLSAMRDLSFSLPKARLRDGATVFKVQNPRGRIALFTGCTVDFLYPAMGMSFIKALNALGYEVVLPKGEVCCGAPLLGLGLRDDAAALAERNLDAFSKLQAEAVVSLCPTCVHFIRDKYKGLIGEGIGTAVDSVTLLAGLLPDSGIMPVRDDRTVMYHAPCHGVNHLGIRDEPQRILAALGHTITEPSDKGCCGFGGTVRLLHDHVSKAVLEQRIGAYRDADLLVTSCPNCILHFSSALGSRPVKHIAELVADRLQGR